MKNKKLLVTFLSSYKRVTVCVTVCVLTSRSTVVAKLTASFWLQLTAFCSV